MGVLWEKSRSFLGAMSELPRSYHGGSKRKQRDLKEQTAECQPSKIGKQDMSQREILSTIDDTNIHLFYETSMNIEIHQKP